MPEAFPTLARAALFEARGGSLALVAGDAGDPATRALAARARRVLGPDDAVVVTAPGAPPAHVDPSWFTGRGPVNGRPAAYLCRGTTCSLPIADPEDLA
jgi:uncharacterized protein YyaL (SSP411 family)